MMNAKRIVNTVIAPWKQNYRIPFSAIPLGGFFLWGGPDEVFVRKLNEEVRLLNCLLVNAQAMVSGDLVRIDQTEMVTPVVFKFVKGRE